MKNSIGATFLAGALLCASPATTSASDAENLGVPENHILRDSRLFNPLTTTPDATINGNVRRVDEEFAAEVRQATLCILTQPLRDGIPQEERAAAASREHQRRSFSFVDPTSGSTYYGYAANHGPYPVAGSHDFACTPEPRYRVSYDYTPKYPVHNPPDELVLYTRTSDGVLRVFDDAGLDGNINCRGETTVDDDSDHPEGELFGQFHYLPGEQRVWKMRYRQAIKAVLDLCGAQNRSSTKNKGTCDSTDFHSCA